MTRRVLFRGLVVAIGAMVWALLPHSERTNG